MQIHKKYSVVFNHEESEEQQVLKMACYFSNLSYNEHKGDLSGYEIEIDWCGGIKTIFTYCGKLSPEYITELYRETPFESSSYLQTGFYMTLEEVKIIDGVIDDFVTEYKMPDLGYVIAKRMEDYIKANSIPNT
jgi:hypothetical protein